MVYIVQAEALPDARSLSPRASCLSHVAMHCQCKAAQHRMRLEVGEAAAANVHLSETSTQPATHAVTARCGTAAVPLDGTWYMVTRHHVVLSNLIKSTDHQ